MANAVGAFSTTPWPAAPASGRLRLAGRCGNVLRGLGLEPEQRVALLLPDGAGWAAVLFGALRVGAVADPLNTRLAPAQWAALLRDSRARVLVADPARLAQAKGALTELPYLRAVVATGAGPGTRSSRWHSWWRAAQRSPRSW
jgi:acyl-CoA synthetase (AMP-forming)/AMP-acid ligase II